MKYVKLSLVTVLVLLLSVSFVGCNRVERLPAPDNIELSVVGRLLTINWDAVDNAQGYIIHIDSTNCTGGHRIINTVTKQATHRITGAEATTAVRETPVINLLSGVTGAVTFINDTTVTLWLMAKTRVELPPEQSEISEEERLKIPHPNALIITIQAISAVDSSISDSRFSSPKRINAVDFLPHQD